MNIQQIPSSDWIDLKQVELAYPFSRRTAWKWISEGRLKAYKPFSRKILLRRSEIDRLLEATKIGTDLDKLVNEVVAEVAK